MKHHILKAAGLSLTLLTAWTLPLFPGELPAEAISADYPAQLINIATKDNSAVLTESGADDGSAVSAQVLGDNLSCAWRFDRVNADANGTFFKLTNAESGRMLTPDGYKATNGTGVIMYGAEADKTQHWYVIPVEKDRLGNGLYYKIVNYADTSLALTLGTNGLTLSPYKQADNQLFLLNSDGLQGFAGYCKNDQTGHIKAADIGGLFGEVVEAADFATLAKYAQDDTPYTIVITGDMKVTNLKLDSQNHYYCPDGRIYVHSNKTIIGSYGRHTLYNVQFCTSSNKGKGDNLILKNMDLQHDSNSNGNDSIVVYFGSGENLWVDHCTFTGHNDYNKAASGQPDYDKFLACCYDADYCTVSDNSFGLHEYGLILGYPDDTADVKSKYDNYPCMSLVSNKFDKTLTRGPGLMRWGYFHSLCNYVNQFSMAYTVHSGCDIYAENCVYENGGNVICDWNSITFPGAYAESGSKFSNCQRTKQGEGTASNPSYSIASNFRPAGNYAYKTISADLTKTYCNLYSGCQSKGENVAYLRYSKAGVPSAGFSTLPSGPMGPKAAVIPDGETFRLMNVNSGLYMQVEGGIAGNNANVQQWGTTGNTTHDIWKIMDAGDGYYYIASALDENYVLDVAGKNAENGTNIGLYKRTGGDNQQFMFTENADGSYTVLTKISQCSSAVEVESGLTTAGANIQEWESNQETCQHWYLVPASIPYSGKLAQNVAVLDSDNSGDWGIAYDTRAGATIFGDRDFTFTTLPQVLLGSERIVTACDSKMFAGDEAIFTAAKDIKLYIGLDSRLQVIPAWLEGFTKINGSCSTSNELTLNVYETTVKAGENFTLGTNGANGSVVNYAVFLQEVQAEPVYGDVNADGVFNVSDLVALQNWLLGESNADIKDTSAADCNADGILTAVDFSLLKALYLGK